MHFYWGIQYLLKIEYICYFIRLMVDSYNWNCHGGQQPHWPAKQANRLSPPITPFPTIGPGQEI